MPRESNAEFGAALSRWWHQVRHSSTVRYFIGKGAVLLPLNVTALGLGFVSTILFARMLTPAQFGQYSFVLATSMLINFLALPGMQTAIAQAAAQGFDGVLARATRVRVKFSLLGSAALVAIGFLSWQSHGPEVAVGFGLAALVFPMTHAVDGYWHHLTGRQLFEQMARWRLVQIIVPTVAVWIALVLTRMFLWALAASFISSAVLNMWFYQQARRRFCRNSELKPGALGYGSRLSVLGVLKSVEGRADHVLLGAFLPAEQLGWFNMGDRISDAALKTPWTIVSQMLFPRLAEVPEKEARRRTLVWGAYLVIGFLGIVAVFWILAPLVLPWLLGPAHRESIRLSQWLALIAAGSVPWSVFEVYAHARAAERSLWISRLVVTLTHLATLPIFLLWWGVTGVLLSIVVSRVACIGICAWLFWRRVS